LELHPKIFISSYKVSKSMIKGLKLASMDDEREKLSQRSLFILMWTTSVAQFILLEGSVILKDIRESNII